MEIEFDFSDETMIESEGKYDAVNRLFNETPFGNKDWMVRTMLTMESIHGIGNFILHLHQNKDIIIMEYASSVNDIYTNPDVSFLSEWAVESGWNRPKVSRDLITTNMNFWKHFWEVGLVGSDLFDKRLRKAKPIISDTIIDDEMEEIEEFKESDK